MPMYLTRFSYTPETWARLVKNPEDLGCCGRNLILVRRTLRGEIIGVIGRSELNCTLKP